MFIRCIPLQYLCVVASCFFFVAQFGVWLSRLSQSETLLPLLVLQIWLRSSARVCSLVFVFSFSSFIFQPFYFSLDVSKSQWKVRRKTRGFFSVFTFNEWTSCVFGNTIWSLIAYILSNTYFFFISVRFKISKKKTTTTVFPFDFGLGVCVRVNRP